MQIMEKLDDALKYYDKAIELNPNNIYAFINKGNALAKLGKNEEALRCYDKAIDLNPKEVDLQYIKV